MADIVKKGGGDKRLRGAEVASQNRRLIMCRSSDRPSS